MRGVTINSQREKYWVVLIILLLWLLSLLLISMSFFEQKERYVEQQNITQEMTWKAVQSIHTKGVDTYFYSLKSSKEAMGLLLLAQDPQHIKRARLSLYRLLYEDYQTLKEQGLFILHFQTPEAKSFLRFHMPSKFGDDLTGVRPSILRVKETLSPLHVFEVGVLQSGFRHVYPIIKNDIFLGTVEFSQTFESLRNEMALLDSRLEYRLIHKKSLPQLSQAENVDHIFGGSIFSDKWLEDDPQGQLYASSTLMSQEMAAVGRAAKEDHRVALGLASGSSFSQAFYLDGGYKMLNFTAIKDLNDENSAYLISYLEAKGLDQLLSNGLIVALMTTVVALILGFISFSWVSVKCAQQQSLNFLKHINMAMAEGLYVVNSEGLITEINSAALAFLGGTEETVIGQHVQDLFRTEGLAVDHPGKCCYLGCSNEDYFSNELQVLNYEKEPRWVKMRGRPLVEGGRNQGNVVVFHDITSERESAESLRIAATAFETQVGIIIADPAGVIIRVNSAFTELTGYASDEVIGLTPGALLSSGVQNKDFYAEMWTTMQEKQYWQGEVWNRRKDGALFLEWLTIDAVLSEAGEVTQYVGSFSDITEQKKAQEEIVQLAFYDPLTKLPNRRLLIERLKQAIVTSERLQQCGGLIFIDLDNFKALNDTKGHTMGDELLMQVAKRLKSVVRETDTVARLGGDEFVVLLTDLGLKGEDAINTVKVVATGILESFTEGFELGSGVYRSSASIGVEMFLGKNQSDEEVLKRADMAMYQAKKKGRNKVRFFNLEMQERVEKAQACEDDMEVAIQMGFAQLELHYQAQVDTDSTVQSVEALIRWHHPQKGMVPPSDFIQVIENNGQILRVGEWVLRTACAQLFKWQADPALQHLTLAVNISAKQLLNIGFVAQLQSIVEESGIDPKRLKLELTESSVVGDIEQAITIMNAILDLGVELSMDDFGTGYSSLTYLKKLPLAQLKIDQSFVQDLEHDSDSLAIVRTILAMAKTLNLTVVAEGVETLRQKELLEKDGCQLFQGYYYSRPLPVADFEQLVVKGV